MRGRGSPRVAWRLAGRPMKPRGFAMQATPARRGETFAHKYERLVGELLDTLRDEELCESDWSLRVLIRLNSEGLPEAALIFDPATGRTVQKVRLPIDGGEAA